MPAPSPEQIMSILIRLQEAATAGTREPTAVLSAEEHNILLDLHMYDSLAAGVVLQQLREHARGLEGWRAVEVRALNFNMYVRGARDRQRQQAEIESATNVVRLNTQRMANGQRARRHPVEVDTPEGMSPQQMMEAESIRLVAIGLLRSQRGGRLWYDEFHKKIFTDWSGTNDGSTLAPIAVDDAFGDRVTTWLHETDKRCARMNEMQVQRIVQHVAHFETRNEPFDWLVAQEWDGEERLEKLMTRGFGALYTEFNRAAGRCWFVSMCARIREHGCKVDTMPVFVGPQGLTKSQALEVIGGEWYRASSSGVDSKDFLQELHGALVFEVQELHSMISSKFGAAKIKAVLSTRIDHFRMPFGRLAADHKRTAVFAGTTNNRDWHSDDTGGRRFWPIHCGAIDLQWLRDNRGQLFAEADFYYRHRLRGLREAREAESGA